MESSKQSAQHTPETFERLRELALEIATAKGVAETFRTLGRGEYAQAEADYQQAVMAFDVELSAIAKAGGAQ